MPSLSNAGIIIAVISLIIHSGAITYIIKLAIRFEVLERLFAEKKNALSTVSTNQADLDKRLALVERAVVNMEQVLPELKTLGSINTKLEQLVDLQKGNVPRAEMETKLESQSNRITLLEGEVFHKQ